MKIRSVTIFNGANDARSKEGIARAGKAASAVKKRLIDAGFEVQTTRLALAPAYTWITGLDTANTISAAKEIEARTNEAGIDYVSFGPVADKQDHSENIAKLPDVIAATRAVFASVVISGFEVVNGWVLQPVADAIKEIAENTENGFGNLRFAALGHCQAGIPFFPAAYAEFGDSPPRPGSALAIECADLALNASQQMRSPADAANALTWNIEREAMRIETALKNIEAETHFGFAGCDWSLATHPDDACSVGAAIETLTGAPFGEWGTLSAIAILTNAIKRANVRYVGFSGVFLPLLEDAVLAKRTRDIGDLQKLLLYCSVCGSGLDTVPLAGDVPTQSIAALLGDVATLALQLKKPLTARLMPIPGLRAGDPTRFDFPYLVNGHALGLTGGGTALWRNALPSN